MLNEIEQILVDRDELSEEEAHQQYQEFINQCQELDDPFEIEELFTEEFGLEMDYLDQVIYDVTYA